MSIKERLSRLKDLKGEGEIARAAQEAQEAHEKAERDQEKDSKEQKTVQIQEGLAESTVKLVELTSGLEEAEGMDTSGFPAEIVAGIQEEVSGIREEIAQVTKEMGVLQARLDSLAENNAGENVDVVDKGNVVEESEQIEVTKEPVLEQFQKGIDDVEETPDESGEGDKEIKDLKKEIQRIEEIIKNAELYGGILPETKLNKDEWERYTKEVNQLSEQEGLISRWQVDKLVSEAQSEEDKNKIRDKYKKDYDKVSSIGRRVQFKIWRELMDKARGLKGNLKDLEAKNKSSE